VSVVHSIVGSSLRWVAAMASGAFVVWSSVAFLAVNVTPAIEGAVVLKHGDGRALRHIANLEPMPAGSITALAPMPTTKASPAIVQATTETVKPAESLLDDRWRVAAGLNVRRDASSRSAVIGTLAKGRTVRVIDSRRGWRLVEYESGLRGWVYGRYLTQEATVAAAE
jgi:uncharacterized protein YgiM (DUF1202 family)